MPPNVLLVVLDTARADALEPYGAPRGAAPASPTSPRRGGRCRRVRDRLLDPALARVDVHRPAAAGARASARRPGGRRTARARCSRRTRAAAARGAAPRRLRDPRRSAPTSGSARRVGLRHRLRRVRGGRHRPRQARAASARTCAAALAWALRGPAARTPTTARPRPRRSLERWLAEPREQPFFWFVNLVECHSPYLPPQALQRPRPARAHAGGRGGAPLPDPRARSGARAWAASTCPTEALERMRHLYARSVRLLDDWLGRVLDALDRRAACSTRRW